MSKDAGFAMDARFWTRLQTLYPNPTAVAHDLRRRTKQVRESKGMEVPVLINDKMEVIG